MIRLFDATKAGHWVLCLLLLVPSPLFSASAEGAPAEQGPAEKGPAEQGSAEQAPAEKGSVEQGPAEQAPVEQAPAVQGPAEQAPVEQAPVEQPAAEPSPEKPEALPKEETKTGLPYISGGVGVEEQAQMRKQSAAFNVKLVFALKSKEYIASVKVMIEDRNGNELLNTVSEGPWFYIQLPPGVYRLKCTFREQTKEIRELRVSKDTQPTRTLLWDAQPKKSEMRTEGEGS